MRIVLTLCHELILITGTVAELMHRSSDTPEPPPPVNRNASSRCDFTHPSSQRTISSHLAAVRAQANEPLLLLGHKRTFHCNKGDKTNPIPGSTCRQDPVEAQDCPTHPLAHLTLARSKT